jgi:hypothetical protein
MNHSTPLRAESDAPTIQYANLPSGGPAATGSLPGPNQHISRTLSGFRAFVEQGSIILRASAPTQCLPGDLQAVVADVASRLGSVSVESNHRSSGRAIDFRVRTRARGVMAYLRSRPEVGGLKVYRNGIIHIDNGERRSW